MQSVSDSFFLLTLAQGEMMKKNGWMTLLMLPLMLTPVFAANTDSLAMVKFMDGIKANSTSIESFSCTMRAFMKVSGNEQITNLKIPTDTTFSKLWAIYPDKFRTEMKNKAMDFVTVTNGKKTYMINKKTNKTDLIDSTKNAFDGVMINSNAILNCFVGKPKFRVLSGDTSAEMWGRFNQNGQTGMATLGCDLRRNVITEYTVTTSNGGEAKFVLEYLKVGGKYFVKKMVTTSENSGVSVLITAQFANIKLNESIDEKLFVVKL